MEEKTIKCLRRVISGAKWWEVTELQMSAVTMGETSRRTIISAGHHLANTTPAVVHGGGIIISVAVNRGLVRGEGRMKSCLWGDSVTVT